MSSKNTTSLLKLADKKIPSYNKKVAVLFFSSAYVNAHFTLEWFSKLDCIAKQIGILELLTFWGKITKIRGRIFPLHDGIIRRFAGVSM